MWTLQVRSPHATPSSGHSLPCPGSGEWRRLWPGHPEAWAKHHAGRGCHVDGEADAVRYPQSSDSWAPTAGSASGAPRPTLYALLWPCAEFPASRGVSSWCRREQVRSQQVERGHVSTQGTQGPPTWRGERAAPFTQSLATLLVQAR